MRGDSPGGSRQLSGLLEDAAEEIYLDLREYYDLDLNGWLEGHYPVTVPAVLAMIRDLPRGSRFAALATLRRRKGLIEVPEAMEPDDDAMELMDLRQWGSLERELAAGQLNVLNELLRFGPSWKKTPQQSAVVGPRDWWPEDQRKKHDEKLGKQNTKSDAKNLSVGSVMSALGWSGN